MSEHFPSIFKALDSVSSHANYKPGNKKDSVVLIAVMKPSDVAPEGTGLGRVLRHSGET